MTLLGIATGARLNPNKDLPLHLEQLDASGAQAVRRSCDWASTEKTMGSGDYDWSREDAVIDAVRAHGLHYLTTLAGRNDQHLLDADHIGPFADFAGAVAARYGSDDLCIGFEGPNEIMLGTKYDTNPTPARYAALQRAMYAAVKAETSKPCGTSAFIGKTQYLADLYALPAGSWRGHWDYLTVHPYTHPLSPRESRDDQRGGWWGMIQKRALMVANGDAELPVWITEYGSPTGGRTSDVRSEDQQASDLHQAVSAFRRHKWAGPFFWFTGWDPETQTNDPGDWMGLYRADGSPKAALDVFRELV